MFSKNFGKTNLFYFCYIIVLISEFNMENFELHNPYERILQRQFFHYLIILAFLIYAEEYRYLYYICMFIFYINL